MSTRAYEVTCYAINHGHPDEMKRIMHGASFSQIVATLELAYKKAGTTLISVEIIDIEERERLEDGPRTV
jgi:hypothetical protein